MRSRYSATLFTVLLLLPPFGSARADEFGRSRRIDPHRSEQKPDEPAPVAPVGSVAQTQDPVDRALREALQREEEWPRSTEGPPREPSRSPKRKDDGSFHFGLMGAYWPSWTPAFNADTGTNPATQRGLVTFAGATKLDSQSDSVRLATWIDKGPFEIRLSWAQGSNEGSQTVVDTDERRTLEYRVADAEGTFSVLSSDRGSVALSIGVRYVFSLASETIDSAFDPVADQIVPGGRSQTHIEALLPTIGLAGSLRVFTGDLFAAELGLRGRVGWIGFPGVDALSGGAELSGTFLYDEFVGLTAGYAFEGARLRRVVSDQSRVSRWLVHGPFVGVMLQF